MEALLAERQQGLVEAVELTHLALIVATGDRETVRFVLTEAAHHFEEVAEDMRAFAMKTDARRRALRSDDEEDAYWRAVARIAGARGVVAPWQREIEP